MLLIGQFDSPFVRRVGIALRLHGLAFAHERWSVFGDAEKVRGYNPLGRVPVLVLDDEVALIESGAILDYLDDLAGDAALLPARGLARRDAVRRMALAMGLAEKAVALVYERLLHDTPQDFVVRRIESQMGAALAALERDCATARPFWFGGGPGHDDIALACAVGFIHQAHPHVSVGPDAAAHAARCEALAVFADVRQVFVPPA